MHQTPRSLWRLRGTTSAAMPVAARSSAISQLSRQYVRRLLRRWGRITTSIATPYFGAFSRRSKVVLTSHAWVGRTSLSKRPITAKGCFGSIVDVSSSSMKLGAGVAPGVDVAGLSCSSRSF